MFARAEAIGFRPATNADIDYILIDGYNPNRDRVAVSANEVSKLEPPVPFTTKLSAAGWNSNSPCCMNNSGPSAPDENRDMQRMSSQQATIQARLPFVALFLILMAAYLIINLANFQFFPRSVRQELEKIGNSITNTTLRIPAERGRIYDRDGEPLAFNLVQYRLGVSPALVSDSETLMKALAEILDIDDFELYRKITSDRVWEFIAGPISAEQGQAIVALDNISLGLEEIPKRFYPQGELAAHVIGIVVDDGLRGALGVEGAYNDTLSGRVLDLSVSKVPFDLPEDRPAEQRGQDIVLTLDRDVQFWAESELRKRWRNTALSAAPSS